MNGANQKRPRAVIPVTVASSNPFCPLRTKTLHCWRAGPGKEKRPRAGKACGRECQPYQLPAACQAIPTCVSPLSGGLSELSRPVFLPSIADDHRHTVWLIAKCNIAHRLPCVKQSGVIDSARGSVKQVSPGGVEWLRRLDRRRPAPDRPRLP